MGNLKEGKWVGLDELHRKEKLKVEGLESVEAHQPERKK